MPGSDRVFVYGSLMGGFERNTVLASARFEGSARTESPFALIDLGSFPGAMEGGTHPVVGEVYTVDKATLATLDRLEGCPDLYARIEVVLEDGTRAWMYLLQPDGLARVGVRERPYVPEGDWRAWSARNPGA